MASKLTQYMFSWKTAETLSLRQISSSLFDDSGFPNCIAHRCMAERIDLEGVQSVHLHTRYPIHVPSTRSSKKRQYETDQSPVTIFLYTFEHVHPSLQCLEVS